LQKQADGAIEIRFNPHRISRIGLVRVVYLLHDRGPPRVILTYGNEQLRTETYDRIGAALNRIEELTAMGLPAARAHLATRERPLYRPRVLHRERILSLLKAWMLHSPWSAELHANLHSAMLLEGAVVVRKPRGSERLVIDYWGTERDLLGQPWMGIAPGRDVEDQPFRNLGVWVAARYREALADGLPRLHDVDIVVPQADGRVINRLYDRLLLPWRGANGENYAVTEPDECRRQAFGRGQGLRGAGNFVTADAASRGSSGSSRSRRPIKWCGRPDLNRHRPCGPTDFHARYGFRRPFPRVFHAGTVWGLDYPFTLAVRL
jgi:hypothetical protein